MTEPTGVQYACDLCGFTTPELPAIVLHLAEVHGISDPARVGAIIQEDGKLILQTEGREAWVVDIETWLSELIKKGW